MANPSPTLSRQLLSRVLGFSTDASQRQIETATQRLLKRLLARLSAVGEIEATALRREISDLETSSAYFLAPSEAGSSPGDRIRRRRLLGSLLSAALVLGVLTAYAAGFRVTRQLDPNEVVRVADPARLSLDGSLPGAILRVLDADREELLLKVPADGAELELAPGRYALDVSREDCPDHWTRSVFFEEGTTHRYEPQICVGEGRLTVRSNVARDRLRIDGLDLGPTREKPHLVGVGDHEIRVEKLGYQPFIGQIRIRSGQVLTLYAELVAESSDRAPIGRPMPVEKVSPSTAPLTTLRPEPFDLPNLREDFAPEVRDLGFSDNRWLHDDVESHLSSGGSTRWHDRISAQMLARYDLDASGRIDRLEESEAIPCRVWREIERDFDGGGLGLSMVRYYGFDGSEWHPSALGFAEAHRSAVYEKMKECGLQS